MGEEQEWHEAANHVFCVNNCGFFGSPTTLNLCSKCYTDHFSNPKQHASRATSSSSLSITTDQHHDDVDLSPSLFRDHVVPKPQLRNQCGSCNRRVGLTGFKCRCGTTFCGVHRYPEFHACTFDFKTMGKEAIAKANPVVKAAKLNKI